MKNTNMMALILAAGLVLPSAAAISIPQAPVVTYGLVRDEYGTPMTSAQSVALALVKDADRDGRVYAESKVGETSIPGMNYRLSLEMDSSATGGRKNAVTSGTRMFIRATQDGTDVELAPKASFAAPKQGTMQRLDYTIGEDADGDGMPDAWERLILMYAGMDDDDAAIAAFRPNDDADGDGMTNLQEYMAGTDPFLDTDLVKITSFALVPGTQRAKITFTTSFNRKFRVVMATSLAKPDWSPCATADTLDAEATYQVYTGDGFEKTVYIDARMSAAFLRIAVN